MGKRVSHSVLDPLLTLPIKARYESFRIPKRLPPEAIVLSGHLSAILGAVGFAFATTTWWGGLLAAFGVTGNHLADVLDGTHARRTGQCRNGGELLDHFADPLSFSYWLVGICVGCGRLELAIAAVICLYATAVLTNIKAKLIGEFALARFGPTEFKSLLVLLGISLSVFVTIALPSVNVVDVATAFVVLLLAVGVVQLVVSLLKAIVEVNRHGGEPDTTEWEITADASDHDERQNRRVTSSKAASS